MKKSAFVYTLAEEIISELKTYCKRIRIAGSLRRKEKSVHDIDLVLIPKNRERLEEFMEKKGERLQGGKYESTWLVKGVKVELYYTNEKEWCAELLAYSSRKGSGIGLRMVAKRRGLRLNQHGLFRRKTGKRIAGKTEREIYAALGRRYKSPRDR